MDEAADDPRFDTFTKAVEAAGLTETLNSSTVTVFAPTDEAFARMPEDELDALMQPGNKDRLKAVLSYHVVPGTLTSDEARQKSGLNPETVQGQSVRIDATGGVHVSTPTDIVTGNEGVYMVDEEKATVCGNVKITRDTNQLNGECAVVNMKTGRSTLQGGGTGGGTIISGWRHSYGR